MEVKRSSYTSEDRALFKQAAEAFFAGRSGEVPCDVCKAPIEFRTEGAIVKHTCRCGKFNGVLKTF